MNRNAEWNVYCKDIADQIPVSVEHCAQRAIARARILKIRRNLIRIPAASLLALLVLFTVLVNTSISFAKAVGTIPTLRELAQFVAQSPSVRAAIDYDFVQPLELTQKRDGTTVTIHYAIADERRLSLYYSVIDATGKDSGYVVVDSELSENGSMGIFPLMHGDQYNNDGYYGDIREIRFDIFQDYALPLETTLTFNLREAADVLNNPDLGHHSTFLELTDDVWRFEISLDPKLTPRNLIVFEQHGTLSGSADADSNVPNNALHAEQPNDQESALPNVIIYEINEWLTVEGQRLCILELAVYPTGSWLSYRPDPENTSIFGLSGLKLEDENGNIWGNRQDNGVTAYSYSDGTEEVFIESTYFSNPQNLTLIITNLSLSSLEKRFATINTHEMTLTGLPDNIRLVTLERNGERLNVRFECDFDMVGGYSNPASFWQPFSYYYTTADGSKHQLILGDLQETDNNKPGVFYVNYSVDVFDEGPIVLELGRRKWHEVVGIRIPIK